MVRVGRPQRTVVGPVALGATAAAGAGFLAWAARGRSSTVFGPSVYCGPAEEKAVALTFDDGPSPSTPRLLDELARHGVPATFFVCGMHVRRLPGIVRECVGAGHEIGNHTETHPPLWLRSQEFIRSELRCAQESISHATGAAPVLFRAPYGVRWFGVGDVQAELGLMGVMWTILGRDWRGSPAAVADRVWRDRRNGAIICLHDGRERQIEPDISTTIAAVREILPRMLGAGYRFLTVSALIFDRGGLKHKIKEI